MGEDALPAPGSMAAAQMGCICAVRDNSYGYGMYLNEYGDPMYSVNMACKVHGRPPEVKDDGKRRDYT
jgi:hypothetical protein